MAIAPCLVLADPGFYERFQAAEPAEQQEMVRELNSNPASKYQVFRDASPEERQVIQRALMELTREQDRQRTEEWLVLPEEERERRLEQAQESREKADALEKRVREQIRRFHNPPSEEELQEEAAQRAQRAEERRIAFINEMAERYPERMEATERPERDIDRWRFQSMMEIAGDFLFSLHNPWDNLGAWIGVGESFHGIVVTGFDPEARSLVVASGDHTRTLLLSGPGGRETPGIRVPPSIPELREEYGTFHARWTAAVEESSELREIGERYDELARALRDAHRTRVALGSSGEPMSDERHARMRPIVREIALEIQTIRREARELTDHLVQRLDAREDFQDLGLVASGDLTRFMLHGREGDL